MELSPTRSQLQAFSKAIEAANGLALETEPAARLSELLRSRVEEHQLLTDEYLDRLAKNHHELQTLAQILVVGETYFFRHIEQLRAFADEALPERSRARPSQQIRILSVGCSSGEEPYSLAILAQMAGFPKTKLAITALDISLESLSKAKLGVYSPWSLRVTPRELRARWFTEQGPNVVLDSSIRDSVTFQQANLADESSHHWAPDSYDIIFCRNVLMYFGLAGAQRALKRLRDALAPGGYLFLGHAENLRGAWLNDFELLHTHDCFYYRKPEKQTPCNDDRRTLSAEVNRASQASLEATAQTAQVSLERVQALASRTTLAPLRASYQKNITEAWRLLEREQFTELFETLRDDSGEVLDHPEARLLGAVALVNLGEYDSAEATCQNLLECNGPRAGVHYLLGLCREGRREFTAAVREHQKSSALDTAFAMPRIHLALLARRSGDITSARREFEVARLLLHHEKPKRLRLFSAGFGRDALLQFCSTELDALVSKRGRPR